MFIRRTLSPTITGLGFPVAIAIAIHAGITKGGVFAAAVGALYLMAVFPIFILESIQKTPEFLDSLSYTREIQRRDFITLLAILIFSILVLVFGPN